MPGRRIVVFLAAGLLCLSAYSQELRTPGTLPREARQFDFWLGGWSVNLRTLQDDLSWRDTTAARAHIYPILRGKAVLELWDSERIKGFSLRYFDVARDEWVLWLNWPGADRSGSSSLAGSFRHGRGEFYSTSERPDGTEIIARYSFSDISADSLRWDDAFSDDGGRTWTHGWIMEFTRAQATVELPAAGGIAHTFETGERCSLPQFRAYEGLVGRTTGSVEADPATQTGYRVLDGCAVLATMRTESASADNDVFVHVTYNTYASRFELLVLDGRAETPAEILFAEEGSEDLVFYRSAEGDPDARVRLELGDDNSSTWTWESAAVDGSWTPTRRASFRSDS